LQTANNALGRIFVPATNASLLAAARLMKPDDALGTWTMPYDAFHTTQAGAQAYPGTMLMSADVPTSGLPAGDAARYAQFLRFVAGTAQTAGLGNGQLPPGYVPMTSANGLGAMAAYTVKAADAIAAQNCAVLDPSGKPGTSGCPVPAAPQAPPPPHASSPAPTPTATTAPTTAAPKPTTSTVHAAPVAQTSKIGTGPLSFTLPIVAVLASLLLCLFAWRMGVGRR
jgi:hypothetical protein